MSTGLVPLNLAEIRAADLTSIELAPVATMITFASLPIASC